MKKVITLKIGGKAAERTGLVRSLAKEILSLQDRYRLLLVHGGGGEVSRISEKLGIEPVFREGLRLTSPEEMEIVEMTLSGKVNKRLVRTFQSTGLEAVGLCGADGRVFTGVSLGGDGRESRTGRIAEVDLKLLKLILGQGYFPVISSTSMDGAGEGLNINADEVAFELACALESAALIFLSDIPGILKEGRVLARLSARDAPGEIEKGVVSGGMVPKVRSALEALRRGVGQIIIGQYRQAGDLEPLLKGRSGTRITSD